MKPVLRLLAGLLALVVVVVVGLAAYFSLIFDPNDYRDRLVELVKTQTGRTLTLSGPIELSLFPWLGFSVGAAELGNAKGFSDRPFASLASAEARVKLLPLLTSTVAIDRVRITGLQLSLERRADGQTNWADLGRNAATDEVPVKGKAPGTDAGSPGAQLSVGGIDVSDAVVRWSDAKAGKDFMFSDVDVSTGRIAPGEAFDFKGGFGFSIATPAANGRLDFSGTATLDTAKAQYAVDGLRLTLAAEGAGLPEGKLSVGLLADVRSDLNAGTLSLTGLNAKTLDMLMTGQVAVTGLKNHPAYEGQLSIDGLNPRVVMKALGMTPPVTANAERLKRASFKARVSGTDKAVAFEDMAASLDDSKLTGRVAVEDFARKALRFDVSVDALDVDSYLPPATVSPGPEPDARSGEGEPAKATQPLDLRGQDVAGRLRVGTLKVSGLTLTSVDTQIKLANGRLSLAPKASLYDGRLDMDTTLTARGEREQLAVSGGLNDVRLDPLLRDLTGKPERLSGVGTVGLKLAGQGLGAEALKRTLAGTVSLKVRDGAVKGVNIAQFLREAQARLEGAAAATTQGVQQTDFSDLTATVNLGDGVARNTDLNLRSPLLRVNGEGSANLVKERIDYLVKASVVGTLTGQGGKTLDQVRGVTVPVRVGGTFAQPTYQLDVEALLAEAAKGKLDEQKAKLKERVKEEREKAKGQLKDELRKGLEGLFK
ncbi:AsmA family protein [Nitrogeniibacter mangrovi]|uniref:AsmA family protein n=1 Tax=Nitrogeniibacter mangrovi TaxID=2016596 RepID=A0A6C1B000_9RHOO|nr:AsmA family protein [Nitrogeniibacter mangrovi]QID16703.1 AsmA family protein [Nitrogeniibacter mangrovi]